VPPDTLSVILRSASFIALFQAAGMAIFLAMFGRPLEVSLSPMQRIAKLSAIAAGVLLVGHYALEAARMAGDMSGMLDPSLQMMAMHSARSTVLAVRLLGLIVLAMAVGRRGNVGTTLSVIGAGIVAASFMLTGHTIVNPQSWVLAPLLTIHVMIVAFWFGALLPLYLVCTRETPVIAGQVTDAFSKIALWLVPGILVAGFLLGLALIRHLAEFRTGYGISLLAKFAGFAVLMGLAAVNKWRLGPAIAGGDARVLASFRRSLAIEYVLICAVLSITAVMTTFYSPES
jgi:putative copper resistance protein D